MSGLKSFARNLSGKRNASGQYSEAAVFGFTRMFFVEKTRQNVSVPPGDDTMRRNVVLITNNPCFRKSVDPLRLQFLCGTSLDVLITARDAIHVGSSLLTHPLCGNLRPNQQPFRSILLQNCGQKERDLNSTLYLDSISTIEEAVLLYRSYGSRLLDPKSLPDAMREDHSFIDYELMRESLTLYGLLPRGHAPNS